MSGLTIPRELLNSHMAFLGMTGAGKTNDVKTIIEWLAEHGERVCVLDTVKSDHWGLTSSADGKQPGLPFTILGGPRGHVPLHAGSGKVIGELVAKGALPLSILDCADFKMGGIQQFFCDFAEALFRNIEGVLHLVIEEAHEIAPKERAGFGDENMAVYWAKKLATASRSKGIRLIFATQRTQKLHNDLLGSCATVVALRLFSEADQKPVRDWINNATKDKDKRQEVSDTLSELKDGEAWVCSIAVSGGYFKRVQFPLITTFDNSATPTSKAKKINVKTAQVDIDKLRGIMGTAAKEAEANDPKALRKKIADLQAEIAKGAKAVPAAAAQKSGPSTADKAATRQETQQTKAAARAYRKALEVAMKFIVNINASDFFKAGGEAIDKAALEKVLTEATARATALLEAKLTVREKEVGKVRAASETLAAQIQKLLDEDVNVTHQPAFAFKTQAPVVVRPQRPAPAAGDLTGPQRELLKALAWWVAMGHGTVARPQLAAKAGWKPKGSNLRNRLSELSQAGLVEYPHDGQVALTEAGKAAAPEADVSQSLIDSIRAVLTGPQLQVFDVLHTEARAVTRTELAQAMGWEPAGSNLRNRLSELRTLELVAYPAKGVVGLQAWVTNG